MRTFITSDLHLGHDRDFLYTPRGFENIEEHNFQVIQNWNSVVNPDDIVFVLGDLMLNDQQKGIELLSQLNGKIYIILGNHDTDSKIKLYKTLPNVEILGHATVIRYGKFHFYLSHYPTLTSNYDDGKKLSQHMINLCGHTHTKDPFYDWEKGMIYHCELDAHNCYPIALEKIIEDLRNKEK